MRREPAAGKKLSMWELLAPNAQWLGISFMWGALHPVVLPAILASLVPVSRKNTYLGLLTFVGLLIAMVAQPVAGSVSDEWRSALGRRRPMILISTVAACAFLGIIGWGGALAWLAAGYLGLQVCSNAIQGPLQGLLRDRVPTAQLGAASSAKVLIDLISVIAAGLVAGHLLGRVQGGLAAVVVVMGLLLLGSGAVTIFLTPEAPTNMDPRTGDSKSLHAPDEGYGWQAGYRWLIAERALFLLGIYGVQAFGEYYLGDVLEVPNPARSTGDLMATVGAATIALVLAGGWLADHVGAKPILFVGSSCAALGLLLIATTGSMGGVIVFGGLIGVGIGMFLAANWTLANRLAPPAQAGRFLGLTNLATAGAAAAARLQGPAVDWLNSIRPGEWAGYRGLFVFGAACIVASLAFLMRVSARA